MNLSRRQFNIRVFLAFFSSLFAIPTLGREKPQSLSKKTSTVSNDAEFNKIFEDMEKTVIAFFQKAGYQQIPAKPLITGQPFNGGLRYDDTGTLPNMPDGKMIVQGCARIDDLPLKDRHDVLPYFHIFACNRRSDVDREQTFAQKISFLTETIGLPTQRLALVSLSNLEDYRETLTNQGIDWERQVVIRDTAEAKAAGDGSGYFKPKNHPEQPEMMTAGIYVWTGEGQAPAVQAYPLAEQWVEIGEIGLDPATAFGFGFGLERLVYVKSGMFPSWQEQRQYLLKRVEDESQESGAPLPEGYDLFKQAGQAAS